LADSSTNASLSYGTPANNGCEVTSGMWRGRLISAMAQSFSENGPLPQPQAGKFYMDDNRGHTGHTIKSVGTVYEGPESPGDMYLGDTSVVTALGKVYRTVAIKKDGVCDMYLLKPEDEEALIQRAVTTAPGLKLSWTRWIRLTKTQAYPREATDLERAVFGPHCILSSTLVERRVMRKRERDTASRNKRRGETDAVAKLPRKIIKVEVDTPNPEPISPIASNNGTIKLTLELPAATATAANLVRSALAGMVDAMPL
jgi:hypothetical protein